MADGGTYWDGKAVKPPRPHRVTVYQGKDGKWYWRRQAGNNRIDGSFRTRPPS